ncbi:MAG: DNA repair protein RecO [Gammaproteobacteria bacterium]|nr:DNA repair protein RecO [Gammaproteobacteria bacterium]
MIERVTLEPAFVLHGRAYRESSEILDLVTREHGRVSLVARGLRRGKTGLRALLQPFRPLMVSWSGRGEGLMTLRAAEPAGSPADLHGTALMSAFYANELVLRFLHRGDPHPPLFDAYATLIASLGAGSAVEPLLRAFEIRLLAETGYGLILDHDAASGTVLDPAGCYAYVVERGPVPAVAGMPPDVVYSGAQLLAIGAGRFTETACLADARRLLRAVLDHHLGGRPLRTRQVFAAMKR